MSRAARRLVPSSTYLYGIIRRPAPGRTTLLKVLGEGVGDPPALVRLLAHEQIAAIVSTVDPETIGESGGVRGFMRDMAAHADVLNRVLAVRTVLPSRFGIILPGDDALIDEVLAPQHDLFLEMLQRLKGTVELRVTADYVETEVLHQVVREQPQLSRAS